MYYLIDTYTVGAHEMGTSMLFLCPRFTAPSNIVLEYSKLTRWIGFLETNLLPYTFFVFRASCSEKMANLAIFCMSTFKVQSNTTVLLSFIYRVPYFSYFHWITYNICNAYIICRVDKRSVIYLQGHFVFWGGGGRKMSTEIGTYPSA